MRAENRGYDPLSALSLSPKHIRSTRNLKRFEQQTQGRTIDDQAYLPSQAILKSKLDSRRLLEPELVHGDISQTLSIARTEVRPRERPGVFQTAQHAHERDRVLESALRFPESERPVAQSRKSLLSVDDRKKAHDFDERKLKYLGPASQLRQEHAQMK